MPITQGSCNHCGQCCGADGSPEQRNPWPGSWPEALANCIDEEKPGMVRWLNRPYGKVKINGVFYYYIWISGVGLCTDLPKYGDPETYSLECPLLMPDPGDGTRPCAIAGTEWESYCNQENMPSEVDPDDRLLDYWPVRHPLCGYYWEE